MRDKVELGGGRDRRTQTVRREVLVLDCSHVRTPSQFWDAYVAEVPAENSELFGQNLDALWDALSAGGPGSPGCVWLEVHNVEQLVAHGEGGFVRALERIQDDLARQDADTRLNVIKRGAPPRGRLYQHERLRSRELADTVLERAVRWQPRPDTCQMLWLKPQGKCWQRLFLDAGFAVWEEWDDSAIEDDFEELQDELVPVDELIDQRITMVQFYAPADGTPEIRLTLDSGSMVTIVPVDPFDFDSDAVLEIVEQHLE